MTGDDPKAGVPPKMAAAIDAYAETRQAPSIFLRAVLANELDNAMAYAPKDMTLAELRACIRFVFNRVPGRARGSAGNVDAWLGHETKTPAWGNSP